MASPAEAPRHIARFRRSCGARRWGRRAAWVATLLAAFAGVVRPAQGGLRRVEGYAGSERCARCHPKVYAQWRLTSHARMLVDARRDPSAVRATDFNDDIPFEKKDVLYTVGNHWVQKYLTRIEGTFYVLPKYWNLAKRQWEPYSIWNWREQPYNLLCDGCHTVGYNAKTKGFFEPGVGCEACHGPGKKHIETGGRLSEIVNPAKLSADRAMMICMACHTDGMDKETETYPFAVGYVPGKDLGDYLTDFFMPKPNSKRWYWGSLDFKERKRMWYFFQSKFYSSTRACEVCGFDRGATQTHERYMSPSEYCGTCHKSRFENFFGHSGHRPEKTQCTDCHVPAMAKAGRTYSIHDHKFDFSQPRPACTECHEAADVRGKGSRCRNDPPDFHLKPVPYPREMTVEEACVHCHNQQLRERRDGAWARAAIPGLVDRFVVRSGSKGPAQRSARPEGGGAAPAQIVAEQP